MKHIIVINGPNLNLLGVREPEVYGNETYADLCGFIEEKAQSLGVDVSVMQFNCEGDIITALQEATGAGGVVLNAGAYTHYSYAIRDAIAAIKAPVVEVHLSDIESREEFRKVSVIKPVCAAQISGLGFESYGKAMEFLTEKS